MHEIQGAAELASSEVAFPDLQGNALRGVPSVRTESHGAGELSHPNPCLGQGLDGTWGREERGVQGE